MLHNTGVGENEIGETTSPAAAPPAATEAGKQQFLVRGIIGWFAVTAAVRMFGLAATTKEFLTKQLKQQADVGGGSTKCAIFKTQAVEVANLRVFVGEVKGDAYLELFNSELK